MSAVDDKLCDAVQKNYDRRFAAIDKRLDDHDEDITDLKIIVAKLTQLQETHDKSMLAFWSTLQGKWLIIGGVIILVMLTSAAIGQSPLGDYILRYITKSQ